MRTRCARPGCGHPRTGVTKDRGHYEKGAGPCKDLECECPFFVTGLDARWTGGGGPRGGR